MSCDPGVSDGNNEGVGWEVYPDVIDPASTSHIVSNLNPSRYYRFRISAVNAVGEGNASQPMPNPAIKMPTQREFQSLHLLLFFFFIIIFIAFFSFFFFRLLIFLFSSAGAQYLQGVCTCGCFVSCPRDGHNSSVFLFSMFRGMNDEEEGFLC